MGRCRQWGTLVPKLDDLLGIKTALAELDDKELDALGAATSHSPPTAPGLLAWIEAAYHWELHRRGATDYELEPPRAAIPDDEVAASVDAAHELRRMFAKDCGDVLAFFDALVPLLTGETARQQG